MRRWRKRKSWSPHRGGSVARAVRACFLALTAGALLGPSQEAQAEYRHPTLVILIPQVTWSQLRATQAPFIESVLDGSAIGLMPVAAPQDADRSRTYVTLGAGRAAVGTVSIRGRAIEGGGFQVDVAPLLAANQRARTSARPGLLGTRLHALGLTTALLAYGEADTESLPPSVLVVMDEEGRVDGGAIGAAQFTPLGKALEPRAIASDLVQALPCHDVLVLDLTGIALPVADQVVGEAVTVLRRYRGALVLASPLSPPQPDPGLRTLGYLALCDLGGEGASGLFLSRNTRWPGLMTPADFAPTLLARYGGSSEGMGGRALGVEPAADAPARLDRLDAMLTARRRLQVRILPLYGLYWTALAALALAAALWRPGSLRSLALPGLVGALIPLGLLVAPLAGTGELRPGIAALAVAASLALLAGHASRATRALAIVMLLGVAVICADVVCGSHLMRLSPLGFGVLWGARFYGIGNEYAGVLGAMTLLGLGALLQEWPGKGPLAAALGLAIALVIGAPWWGANWGGYFALMAGLISLWAMLSERKLRTAAIGLGLLILGALVPAALDLLRPGGERSHIGLTAAALLAGHTELVSDMVMRKLAMNWSTARQAGGWWALSWLPFVAAGGLVRRADLAQERRLCAGLRGALVVALVAMAVNDSGLVALACALAVAMGALLFTVARTVKQ